MTTELVCENILTLPIVPRRQAPDGTYEFVRHDDYDLGSLSGRVAWFCDEFNVERPSLKLDPEFPDDPEAVLISDDLINWFKENDVSFDYIFSGDIKAFVMAHRCQKSNTQTIIKAMEKMEPQVEAGFTAMLNSIIEHGIPVDEAFASFDRVVSGWRAEQ